MDTATSTHGTTPIVGILEWFRPGEYQEVKDALADLRELGITRIRTGISWADWHLEGTEEWFDWLFHTLAPHVEILPCFLYTPPSLGEEPKTSSPPRDLKAYADFLDVMIEKYGAHFEWVELWNEPNNKIEYDYTLDNSWHKFASMIGMAANWAKVKGKKTVLGGMSPIDPNWLQLMIDHGVMAHIDAIGIHGFPHVFDQQWNGWNTHIRSVKKTLENAGYQKPVWISEVGFSTWQNDEVMQIQEFKEAMEAEADRIYWYALRDLHPRNATVGGYHLDEREYFFGLKKFDGTEKLLYKLLKRGGQRNIKNHPYIQKHYEIPSSEKYILITGGAGFIGTNLAACFLSQGKKVMIYDSLFREGVEKNLQWLQEKYGEKLIIQIANINESRILQQSVNQASEVFHFCAQVAVTSAVKNPFDDFAVNLSGTFHLLEAIRNSPHQPPLIFTSTNKVYGNLQEVKMVEGNTRYYPTDKKMKKYGINEKIPLDFHSPYGCSKGASDQYILDYARTYGLKTAVFRMSCIYGPHQFGTEDQGWVAHFLISALQNDPLTIYGNGKQVRDILYVEDLISAFLLARKHMDKISGEVFNIGGGPENTVSLLELLTLISKKTDTEMKITHKDWRTGDQYYYVSNTEKFRKATGWKPKFTVEEGVENLIRWICENRNLELPDNLNSTKAIAI